MEIADKNTERSTVIIAVLALVIIGASLLISTWQSVQRQQKAEQDHLYLTSRAVLLSIEHYLKRSIIRDSPTSLASRTVDFFESLETQGEIVFAGILDPERGGQLLTTPAHGNAQIYIPLHVLQELFQNGAWHGQLEINKKAVYVYAKKLENSRPRKMHHFSEPRHPLFLMVGIDMEAHTKAHQGYRQAALFQAGYILAAALLSWVLGTSFLARRDQVRRAAIIERFQATLIDSLPDGLLTLRHLEHDIIIEAANPAALEMFPPKLPGALSGQSIAALPQDLKEYIKKAWEHPKPGIWQSLSMQQYELEVLLLPLGGQASSMLIIRDRTLLRTLEKNLAEAEKLALVGTLAAGVAHEIRNPLSALRGFAQYFVKKLAGKKPEETYAKTMVHEADRLNRVITDLLFLGRPKHLAPEQTDLVSLVGELCTLLRFDLEQKHLSIGQDLQASTVYADREALKQALLNLILNSIDATVSQAGDGTSEPGASMMVLSREDSRGVVIEVCDYGSGMTEEQAQKAFDPFFTGKGSGTGLGLCLVRSTMLEHKGSVEIISGIGEGCTVRLFFPRHEVRHETSFDH